ncbi:hypothetical protein LJ656_13260 [Paraburkholderia sp. MMS20-SJTR3]|uniref:CdiI immunity protein domain-containing protein n=1 Tax=Paraburkholderia sejongensis TaxID=2886946 RepID=A0ABS8JUI4_9BURK|nr:contact-dependent growth inhibition system immunity protein [Paraburkholderia sp. MMS20-SJTR3]MCC8393560.1 hypothetical protein [Paraburkholderia sp. MMS20-SJTR3]
MDSLACHPEMDQFFCTYFSQDFDLFGETVREIVECYKFDCPHHYKNLIGELESFRSDHADDLSTAFMPFRHGFHPEGWGYTIATFFDEIQSVLKE